MELVRKYTTPNGFTYYVVRNKKGIETTYGEKVFNQKFKGKLDG